MEKFKENNTSIHIWTSNNSWRKWNSKRLIPSKSFGEGFIEVRYPRSNIADTHIVTDSVRMREKRALRRGLKSNPSRGAIPVDVCGKKGLLDLACVPLHISRGCPRPERRIKAFLVLLSYPAICYLATLLSNDEAF